MEYAAALSLSDEVLSRCQLLNTEFSLLSTPVGMRLKWSCQNEERKVVKISTCLVANMKTSGRLYPIQLNEEMEVGIFGRKSGISSGQLSKCCAAVIIALDTGALMAAHVKFPGTLSILCHPEESVVWSGVCQRKDINLRVKWEEDTVHAIVIADEKMSLHVQDTEDVNNDLVEVVQSCFIEEMTNVLSNVLHVVLIKCQPSGLCLFMNIQVLELMTETLIHKSNCYLVLQLYATSVAITAGKDDRCAIVVISKAGIIYIGLPRRRPKDVPVIKPIEHRKCNLSWHEEKLQNSPLACQSHDNVILISDGISLLLSVVNFLSDSKSKRIDKEKSPKPPEPELASSVKEVLTGIQHCSEMVQAEGSLIRDLDIYMSQLSLAASLLAEPQRDIFSGTAKIEQQLEQKGYYMPVCQVLAMLEWSDSSLVLAVKVAIERLITENGSVPSSISLSADVFEEAQNSCQMLEFESSKAITQVAMNHMHKIVTKTLCNVPL
ncbi:uncharacterized protein LOC135196551 [Macrobrachium nipponense]|uniref:uncharacterized protein LOC135196551 n=1 Tax=Macrobrachium nipponense TaxID=159736 RepID=UPI0030C88695